MLENGEKMFDLNYEALLLSMLGIDLGNGLRYFPTVEEAIRYLVDGIFPLKKEEKPIEKTVVTVTITQGEQLSLF